MPGFKPSAKIEIDSTKCDSTKLAQLEAILYGTDADTENNVEATTARLPLPAEIFQIFGVTNGNG
jgi:hypothetical protein